jgi:polyhydroxybutyrate depolymerase
VHVPSSYAPGSPAPLVLDIHGLTSNAAEQEALSKMNAKSDAKGFLAIYPEGLDSSWNAGACCGRSASDAVDDVGFLTALLDRAEAELCVDRRRVFATGMSNGAFLSHRLACELSSRIAAVAPVAGVNGMPTCKPSRPVPVFHTHGTLDGLVPYLGSPALGFISVNRSFEEWAARNGCTGDPVETFQKDEASCQTYATCTGGAEVTLCTVRGGGHTWPGGMPVPALGFTSNAISATDRMWDFFVKHPMPLP